MRNFTIWYEKGMDGLMNPDTVTLDRLLETHVVLLDMPLPLQIGVPNYDLMCLEALYRQMQGENWSPNGEARELIENKGLNHTSMRVGDVIAAPIGYYVVMPDGFKEIERQRPFSQAQWQRMLEAAEDWRFLNCLVGLTMDRQELLEHVRRTTKAALVVWLMKRFALTQGEARDVSNQSEYLLSFQAGDRQVHWIADRPEPRLSDYPEFGELFR